MQIINGCIVQQVFDTEKKSLLTCQEQSITLPLSEILVWWKRGWHWIKSNEVGDGMQPVFVCERPFMMPKMLVDWVTYGLSLYQEFDEHTGNWDTFLYRFSSSEDTYTSVRSYIDTQFLGYTLEKKGRFVLLAGDKIGYPDQEHIRIQLTHTGHNAALSLLWGICLGYGAESIICHQDSIHITLPLIGTITERTYIIDAVLTDLSSRGIFVHKSLHDQSYGQSLQLRITDRELLSVYAVWFGGDIDLVERKKTYDSLKMDLLTWLGKQTVHTAFLDSIEYSVLKLLKK